MNGHELMNTLSTHGKKGTTSPNMNNNDKLWQEMYHFTQQVTSS